MKGEGVISSRCGSSNCIEVAPSMDGMQVYIRDTDPVPIGVRGPIIVPREVWVALRDGVKAGEFDGI